MIPRSAEQPVGGFLDRLARSPDPGRRLGSALIWALMVGAVIYTIFYWLEQQDDKLIDRLVVAEASRMSLDVSQQIRERAEALGEFARRWERNPHPEREAWESDAANFLRRDLQIRAIEWVEPSLHVRWVAPPSESLPKGALDPNDDEMRLTALRDIEDRPQLTVSQSFFLRDGIHRQLLITAPMLAETQGKGHIVGVVRVRDLIDALVTKELRRGYSVTVFEDPIHLFGPLWEESGPEAQWAQDARLQVDDLIWRLQVWPGPELAKQLDTHSSVTALILGMLLSLAVGVLVYQAQAARVGTGGTEAAPQQMEDREAKAELGIESGIPPG